MFGEFIKTERLRQNLSLREFCRLSGEDPSNWSKVERGMLVPPQEKDRVEHILAVLGITDANEAERLHEMAVVDAGSIPAYIMAEKDIVDNLPAFLRTLENVKPTKEEFMTLIEMLRSQGA